ncbi:hypothetical protein M409DRAFT_38208 [Zasmidium cellare ATCC 36951]|uniref:Dienelactone hydrolase domain-containing protein n=1 Tax=Zasmidium cellare ATCC 36951 TaxID=1080233 RepID=A0A6A6BWU3_ZASCE|nr:uncharacterized protein M409DRAFT_38208 [Zasmidium cellare ATCC 36951]KAF2158508.1 hypothetical protein M409DRAFT_38208 [Zasmidium cellare ATCC 36951]
MSTDAQVLAKPTSSLCCLNGSIHEGQPKGEILSIEGVDSYIAKPGDGKDSGNIIIYSPDVNGFYNNAFLIMDVMAELSECLVLGIDYFKGFDPWKWQQDHTDNPSQDAVSIEITPKWMKTVHSKYGRKGQAKFACFGYCWGAPFVCDQLSERGICVARAFAHHANLNDANFSDLTKPLLMSLAQKDAVFKRDQRNEVVKIMEDCDKTFHVQLFSKISHGFAVQIGSLLISVRRWVKEKSLQAIGQRLSYYLAESIESSVS